MEEYKTPPAPADRMAIVIIHGIGNQQPLDTLIPFAENLIEEPAREAEPKFWSKPDRQSESFELRRLTARKSKTRPTTDFYEYYWAHRVPGTTYQQILTWARRLVIVHPKKLHRKIRKYWGLSWLVIGVAAFFFVRSFFVGNADTGMSIGNFEIKAWMLSLATSLALPLITGLFEHVMLKYVGDAARYLQPDPENIDVRQTIRAHGIALLRNLHENKNSKGEQRYSRIVLVGHSLGSVIAYDILKHVWDEFNTSQASPPGRLLSQLEAAGRILHDLRASKTSTPASIEASMTTYRRLQRLYWLEQVENAKKSAKPAWLVSDFITLGSPLVHANVLLNTSVSSLDKRQVFRELPTCPPAMDFDKYAQKWRFSYEKWSNQQPTNLFVPDHAAVFSSTMWTNMYFPGDIVGDALAPIFGHGVRDIKLEFPDTISNKHQSATSHTVYWSEVNTNLGAAGYLRYLFRSLKKLKWAEREKTTAHMTYLRRLLDFHQPEKTLATSRQKTVTVSFSKRQFMMGRQCQKALWLEKNRPELKEPFTEGDLLRFELGNLVDAKARLLDPQGFLVEGDHWPLAKHNTAIALTAGHKRLYQAAFEYKGIRIRADILDLNDDGTCTLREVKSGKLERKKDGGPRKFKDEYLLDVATQIYVLAGNNLPVQEAYLTMLHEHYAQGGETPYFDEENVTALANALLADFDESVSQFAETLALEEEPAVPIGFHCKKPSPCIFKAYCWESAPPFSIYNIPYLRSHEEAALKEDNILDASLVPDTFSFGHSYAERYVKVARAGVENIDWTKIKTQINALPKPFYFLDFETFSTPLPSWPETRPHQQIPFQFSCHVLEEDGTLRHFEFLHTSLEDPRTRVAEALVNGIGPDGAILVYNQRFEKKVLEEMAAYLKNYATPLTNMISRLFDQYKLVFDHVDHPELLSSKSLKNVSAILLKDHIDYAALDIADGTSAQAAWYKMVQLPEEERIAEAAALKEYCRHDTLAQVALHRWFMQ